MSTLREIDAKIRSLTNESPLSRPFVCEGSPLGCEIAEVGINPGTDTPFWAFWSGETGFNKHGWLEEYTRRHGKLRPARDRIETLCQALKPVRCIELNLYARHSKREADLEKEHHDASLFNFMLSATKPRLILVHGNSPIKHMQHLLQVPLVKDGFVEVTYQGTSFDVFASKRHFAYVSRDYVREVAERLKTRLDGR